MKRSRYREPRPPVAEPPFPPVDPPFIKALRAVETGDDEAFFAVKREWADVPGAKPVIDAAVIHRRALADFDREARAAIHYFETARETCARWRGIGLDKPNPGPAVYALGVVSGTLRAYAKACSDYCAAYPVEDPGT